MRKNRCPEVRQVMLHHLQHKLVLTGMMTWMTSCPPNHGLQHMMFLPLYMNLESERRQRERQEVRRAILHHLQHKLVLTGMMTWMTSCPYIRKSYNINEVIRKLPVDHKCGIR